AAPRDMVPRANRPRAVPRNPAFRRALVEGISCPPHARQWRSRVRVLPSGRRHLSSKLAASRSLCRRQDRRDRRVHWRRLPARLRPSRGAFALAGFAFAGFALALRLVLNSTGARISAFSAASLTLSPW